MKSIVTIGCILFSFFLTGCFKDEGNYDYKELNAPTWLFNVESEPMYLTSYIGDTVKMRALFRFDNDSVERLANVRYEWRFRDVLFSEDRDLFIPTDTIVKRLGLSLSDLVGSNGTFSIIEKNTGIKYMARVWLTIRPVYNKADWLILSEDGANSKLSYYKIKNKRIGGKVVTTYSLWDNHYGTQNAEHPLLGKPRSLRYSSAPNISVPSGITSVITDKSVYTVNNENFKYVGELKDDFLNGTPNNLNVSSVWHVDRLSYVATEDGRLFRRILSENWLGGKFISEPYVVDSKGYKVTDFGQGTTRSSNYQGISLQPCYDELNRRMMMIQMEAPYRTIPVTLMPGGTNPLPVWEMEEGTELLYLHTKGIDDGSGNMTFTVIFNDKQGDTWMSDFVVDSYTCYCLVDDGASLQRFPGGNLTKESKFLSSVWVPEYLFYTKGKEIRYVYRPNETDYPCVSFNDNVMTFRYNAYNVEYSRLGVGLENGDFVQVNVTSVDKAKILEETRVNVGGKIVYILELATDSFTDLY